MTAQSSNNVSRRGFLLLLAATCLAGDKGRTTFVPLEDARVRRMATWAG